MSLTPEAEARIDDRIRSLSRRGTPAGAGDELRQHVADAAQDLAGSRPATPLHVDEAFVGLGSDDEIRRTFFPQPQRPAVSRATTLLLVGAALVATAAIVAEGGGDASCSVEGPGSCSASTSGYGLDTIFWGAPPLLVLACMLWLPAWSAVAVAGAYAAIAFVGALDAASIGDHVLAAGVVAAAAAIALYASVRHLRSARPPAPT